MQALSCKIFGYSGWAMLLPQAVSGTLSCLLIYLLTAKYFNKQAGLVAALIFAVTPAVVVVSRNSTMDMQLVFWLLLAIWFLMKSIDTGKWRWLLVCGVLIGIGFNVKMLQAYLVVPAVVVTYLVFAKGKMLKRIAAGALAAVLMVGVSFAWIAAVDMTPASQRPYVDSTSNNSALELVFGHNGVERLVGEGGGGGKSGFMEMPGGKFPQMNGQTAFGVDAASDSHRDGKDGLRFGEIPQNSFGGKQGGGGANGIGTASPLRLWNDSLYGQACWLLLFAIAACVLGLRRKGLKEKNPGQRNLVFWGMWLLTAGGFFSFAGFFHPYYLCMIAPPIAVLSGVGLTELFRFFNSYRKTKKALPENTAVPLPEATEKNAQQPSATIRFKLHFNALRPWLLFAALLANIIISFLYVLGYSSVSGWLVPLILAPCAAGIALLAAYLRSSKKVLLKVSAVLLAVSLLAGSTYWAWTPVQTAPNSTIPAAGPASSEIRRMTMQIPNIQQGGPNGSTSSDSTTIADGQMPNGVGPFGDASVNSGLETYLKKHYAEGSFLLTACRSSSVASLIIDTNLPCYAYGGFLGSDNSLTVSKLKEMVTAGKITYFLVSELGGINTSNNLISYVEQNATKINSNEYSSSSNSGRSEGTLYRFSK